MEEKYPILEYDPNPKAIVDPAVCYPKNVLNEKVVITFFQEVINKLKSEDKIIEVAADKSEIGKHPFYNMKEPFDNVSVFHPGLGAPLAAALLEAAIIMGGKEFIVCGSAGLLSNKIHNKFLIPNAAIRDEGTSYHYLAPSYEVKPTQFLLNKIQSYFQKENIAFQVGKTWTTDAFFRETEKKIESRKNSGCITVEMEAAAFFAVAKFRKVSIAQILYASDAVSIEGWDGIHRKNELRNELFWHCVKINQK